MDFNFYQPSGKISPIFYLVAFFFLLLGVPLLSSIYSLLLWYIPFIYIHFIFTGGYGFILVLLLNKILKICKVRNNKTAKYFAILTGIFAVYFIWTSYVTLLYNAGETISSNINTYKLRGLSLTKTFFNIGDFIGISFTPSIITKTMSFLYDNGAWSIRSITVKGFFLALIWFLEAIIIIVVPWLIGTEQVNEPFSEQNNSWFEKKKLPYFIKQPENLDNFLEALKNGNSSILNALEYDNQNSLDYYQITTFAHSKEMIAYINLSNVKVTFDDKGKESNDEKELIKNVKVSLSDLKNLEERFG
jgi:hypothetical protein